MDVSEREFEQAEERMAVLRAAGHAVCARYDRSTSRVMVMLNTGVELAFPTALVEGLAGASPDCLAEIEISPAGLGLHWPQLDADIYVPALLQGVFDSKNGMARQLGTKVAVPAPRPKPQPRVKMVSRVAARGRGQQDKSGGLTASGNHRAG